MDGYGWLCGSWKTSWSKCPSAVRFEQIVAEAPCQTLGRWAGVSRLAGFQTSLAEINAKAARAVRKTGVCLVSLVISMCVVEKTIRNHEDMTTHSRPFKNGWSDLNSSITIQDPWIYLKLFQQHWIATRSRFGQRLHQGKEKEMLREKRELQGERKRRTTAVDSS